MFVLPPLFPQSSLPSLLSSVFLLPPFFTLSGGNIFLIILETLWDVGIPGGEGRVRDEKRAAMDGCLAGHDLLRRKKS